MKTQIVPEQKKNTNFPEQGTTGMKHKSFQNNRNETQIFPEQPE
jgi:hypothetical protein